jgi:hypothetical protein
MHSDELKFEENILKPCKIVFSKDLDSNNIKKVLISFDKQVYAGGNRSYAVFQNEVVSWGEMNI